MKTENKWSNVKKKLLKCSEKDLLLLISDLYSLSNKNKDFLEARFLVDKNILMQYKSNIKKYLAPSESWRKSQQINIKEAKKILSDYKKATNDKKGLIELMVYYVECGTNFLDEYGDLYEQYYDTLEVVFESVITLMKKFSIQEMGAFIKRLRAVVRKAEHFGWGYYDFISDILEDAYPE